MDPYDEDDSTIATSVKVVEKLKYASLRDVPGFPQPVPEHMKQIKDPNGAIMKEAQYAFDILHSMDYLPQDQEFLHRFNLWSNTEVDRSSELEISQDTQKKLLRAMIHSEATTTEEFFDAVNGLSIHLILERHTFRW